MTSSPVCPFFEIGILICVSIDMELEEKDEEESDEEPGIILLSFSLRPS